MFGVNNEFTAYNLKCEHLVEPLGIDNATPRFTWQIKDTRMGAGQKAYRIFVGSDPEDVAKGRGDVWESGEKESDFILATYGGKALEPLKKYYWSVQIRDNKGDLSAISDVASFETGMMRSATWKGSWISDSRDVVIKPAPYFRKSFNVPGEILSARAYIAAAGLFELYINGSRAGDHRLDPTYTRFDRRTLYVTHDITGLLKSGENAAGVLLGNGWYNHQSTAVWFFHEAPWRSRPRFCMEIHVRMKDGSEIIIPSGTDWKTALSPVIFNSIYTAEHYDSRLEKDGWNKPGFNDNDWNNAIYVPAPSQNIVAQAMHPVRAEDEIMSKKVSRTDNRTWYLILEGILPVSAK